MFSSLPRPLVLRIVALSTALACMGAPGVAAAQAPSAPVPGPAPASDEVRLTSGGFVTGRVTEYLPGDHVTILPAGGEVKVIPWAEVQQVSRNGEVLGSAQPPHIPGPPPESEPEPHAPPPGTSGGVLAELGETEPEGLRVRLHQQGGNRPASLFHIDGEAVGYGAGVTVHAVAYSELCAAPCELVITNPGGDFFVGGKSYHASRRFQLPRNRAGYDLNVKPRHKLLSYTGWVLLTGGVAGSALMIMTSFVMDMPISAARGLRGGGAALGAVGLGGGITLLVFGRSKVELMPR